jgi:hypothetical protein
MTNTIKLSLIIIMLLAKVARSVNYDSKGMLQIEAYLYDCKL